MQGDRDDQRRHRACLPCRRSWVRIPSAASEKACICRSFSSTQSAGAFASPGTQWAPGGQHAAGASQKKPVCRHFLMTRTVDLLLMLLLPTRLPRAARPSSGPPTWAHKESPQTRAFLVARGLTAQTAAACPGTERAAAWVAVMRKPPPWADGAWTSAPRPWRVRPSWSSRREPCAVPCGPRAWPCAAPPRPPRSRSRRRRPTGA